MIGSEGCLSIPVVWEKQVLMDERDVWEASGVSHDPGRSFVDNYQTPKSESYISYHYFTSSVKNEVLCCW